MLRDECKWMHLPKCSNDEVFNYKRELSNLTQFIYCIKP